MFEVVFACVYAQIFIHTQTKEALQAFKILCLWEGSSLWLVCSAESPRAFPHDRWPSAPSLWQRERDDTVTKHAKTPPRSCQESIWWKLSVSWWKEKERERNLRKFAGAKDTIIQHLYYGSTVILHCWYLFYYDLCLTWDCSGISCSIEWTLLEMVRFETPSQKVLLGLACNRFCLRSFLWCSNSHTVTTKDMTRGLKEHLVKWCSKKSTCPLRPTHLFIAAHYLPLLATDHPRALDAHSSGLWPDSEENPSSLLGWQ